MDLTSALQKVFSRPYGKVSAAQVSGDRYLGPVHPF